MRNALGFGLIGLVITIAIILLVGGGGYYFINKTNNDKTDLNNLLDVVDDAEDVADDLENNQQVIEQEMLEGQGEVVPYVPTLRVMAPNGGEFFCVGDPIQIEWEASDDIEIVNLYVSVPGVQSNIGSFPAKEGVAFWTPTAGYESRVSRIRVFGRPGGGEGIDDFSDSVFSIILCEG